MLCIKNLSALELGRQGENLARTVQISVAQWYEEYGNDITISLVVQRPTEDYGYFPEITIENGILNWVITNVDTSFAGTGHAELVATDTQGLNVKSKMFKTLIYESLATGESPIVPPPAPSWVDTLLALAEEIEADMEIIEQFADDVQEINERLDKAVYSSQSEEDVEIINCGSATELVTNPS